ncbi:pyocin knob domain-containing protein [Jeongeupia naejangsanensis]|uniref:Uncharacterized protein n=1 Tax=Jeongeupia naejangsanensis TaxID=613195 RepID=A0ABS2BFA9_9NEIS|nr:pyocin knob domain-containing protein [Jeongeupia naejangsanensis]MBM3114294.1 hypothetical protein [Jeongeupia naejangsanensis]
MYRIDNSTAALDKFGPGKNGFQDGVPGLVQATTPGAVTFDRFQEELANAVEGAGLTLDKNDNTQLLQAMQIVADGSTTDETGNPLYVPRAGGAVVQAPLLRTGAGELQDRSGVPDGTDWNTLVGSGFYFFGSDASMATMINAPALHAGLLHVYSSSDAGTEWVFQQYQSYADDRIYRRRFYPTSGWSYWSADFTSSYPQPIPIPPKEVPVGMIAPFNVAPSTVIPGWMPCTGGGYPDLRGRFIRVCSQGSGVDPDGDRGAGTIQGCDVQSHTHGIPVRERESNGGGGWGVDYQGGGLENTWGTGGAETRPTNVSYPHYYYTGVGVGLWTPLQLKHAGIEPAPLSVHQSHLLTGEYLGKYPVQHDPFATKEQGVLVPLIPDGATLEPPPASNDEAGYPRLAVLKTEGWDLVRNWRQVALWRTSNGQAYSPGNWSHDPEWSGLGDLPDWLTDQPPPSDYPLWNATSRAWDVDTVAQQRDAELAKARQDLQSFLVMQGLAPEVAALL